MFLGVLVFMLEVSKFDYFYELLEVCKNFLGIFAHSAAPQSTIHPTKHSKGTSAYISTSKTEDKIETLSMSTGDYNDLDLDY